MSNLTAATKLLCCGRMHIGDGFGRITWRFPCFDFDETLIAPQGTNTHLGDSLIADYWQLSISFPKQGTFAMGR